MEQKWIFERKSQNFEKFWMYEKMGPLRAHFKKNVSIFDFTQFSEKGSLENLEVIVEKVLRSTTQVRKARMHWTHTVPLNRL